MNKKKQALLLLGMLLVLCVGIFASCTNNQVFFNEYTDENLNFVGKIVQAMHGWIGNYGWTVVLFTVFLKILMLPLDMWQRVSGRKSSLKMQKMQPVMDKIDERYGANTPRANEEKQKLYKKQGYSMLSSCLPMVISMLVFFIIFGGLNNYATYSSVHNFKALYNQYNVEYIDKGIATTDEYKLLYTAFYNSLKTENDSKPEANRISEEKLKEIATAQSAHQYAQDNREKNSEYSQKALESIPEFYQNNHESWLWIKNVWQPDTWDTIMQDYDKFTASVSLKGLGTDDGRAIYNAIREEVLSTHTTRAGGNGEWNGLMILPLLSVGLSFLSIFITQQMDKKNRKGAPPQENNQQAMTNKTMMIMMPLMMAVFGFLYTGVFAIYMVVNYGLSILSTVALRLPIEKIVEKSLAKAEAKNNTAKAGYKR